MNAPMLGDSARIPLPAVAEMTPEQRRIYDKVVTGPRGRMIGPLRAAILCKRSVSGSDACCGRYFWPITSSNRHSGVSYCECSIAAKRPTP